MEYRYAGFWRRFGAMWIDVIVLAPLIVGFMWIVASSRLGALAIEIPRLAIFMGYTIYAHGRFGKTIGKHVMGIRIVRTDGQRIGWREAWLRNAPDVALSVVTVSVTMGALLALTDTQYLVGAKMGRRNLAVASELPDWFSWVGWISQAWFWSEFIVMMCNKRRRALHDFIAGTMVVRERTVM